MTQVNDLHQQIHQITDLSNVLGRLISDRSLCDSGITCELFFRYIDAVGHHLTKTESDVFSQLLVGADDHQNKILDHFMDGAREIKLIFTRYVKKWCKQNELKIRDYDEFVQETDEMISFVLRRLNDETENLYPLLSDNSLFKRSRAA